MADITNSINSLKDLLPLKPATQTQITDAELQLRVSFTEEYKEYLKTFGAIIADGFELSGIAKSEHRNVVSLTKKEWSLNPKVPHTMYVIEDTGVDGIVIWQDTKGQIFISTPNTDPQKIAESLSEYVLSK